MPAAGPALLYHEFRKAAQKAGEQPRHFPDWESFRIHYDQNQMENFQARAARGLYVRMSDEQVGEAQRQFPPPVPN